MFRRKPVPSARKTPGTKATAGCRDALRERMPVGKFQSGNRRAGSSHCGAIAFERKKDNRAEWPARDARSKANGGFRYERFAEPGR
jgi:hypothetical protein